MCELPEVYCHKLRKAKKQHKCCSCFGFIEKEEFYNYHSGIWDGEPHSYKVCFDCEKLRKEVDKDIIDVEETTAFEELRDSICNSQDKKLAQKFLDIIIKRKSNRKTDYLLRIINDDKT